MSSQVGNFVFTVCCDGASAPGHGVCHGSPALSRRKSCREGKLLFSKATTCSPVSLCKIFKMSLSLVQGYESPEEEDPQDYLSDSDEEYTGDRVKEKVAPVVKPSKLQPSKPPPRTSDLPTAFEMFTEVTGPPDFLKSSMTARLSGDLTSMTPTDFSRSYVAPQEPKPRHAPVAVAVVEAKPQVSIVGSDTANAAVAAKKRAPGAGLPPAEDAANLLRMCANCGVPKTYSAANEGMVCPVCGDRPVVAGAEEKNKRGNKIKDKEHSKRMKGQSTHSAWKSETEMHLRQQFD